MKQEKKVTVTFHFTITEDDSNIPVGDDDEKEYYQRQRRLYQAIIQDKKNHLDYLCYRAAVSFESIGWQEWFQHMLGDIDIDSMQELSPMIKTMSKSDQDFFRGAKKRELLAENTESAVDCIETELMSIDIVVEE